MFLLSTYVVGTAAFFLGLRDIGLRGDMVSGTFEIFTFILASYFLYLFNKQKNIDRLSSTLLIILFPIVTAGCIMGRGGLSTGNMLMFIILFVILIGTIKRRNILYLAIYGWACVGIVAVAEIMDPTIRASYQSVSDIITSDIMIFTVAGITFFLVYQLTTSYLVERKENLLKNEELRKKNEQIKEQTRQLQEMNEFKTKLFAILGHDMMSPLQGLSSILDFIRNKLATPEEIELMLPSLTHRVQNTSEIINNLFDWSRISLQNEIIHREQFLLKSMVDRITENVTTVYTEKNTTIKNHIPSHLEIEGDASLIETIIRNLVMNAIKYSNNEGEIDVIYVEEEGNHKVCVRDYGIGMSEEIQETLFHFDVESKPGTRGEIGKGLGLFLCKEFVKAHGGEIFVQSEVNKGSEFCFTIPFQHQPKEGKLTLPNAN